MKFRYVFAVNNLSLYTISCDRILDNFYRAILKSINYVQFDKIVTKFEYAFAVNNFLILKLINEISAILNRKDIREIPKRVTSLRIWVL